MRTRLTAQHRGDGPAAAGAGRRPSAVLVAATVILGGVTAVPAASAAVTGTATLTGGTGTVTVGDKLYAKEGAPLTLTIVSEDPTKCVFGVPAGFTGDRDSNVARTSWTFTGKAVAGDAVNTMVVGAATGNSGGNDKCNGQSFSRSVSYTSDNTGPLLTGTPAPEASATGWSKTDTTVTWSATDAGSGVASGPTPASASVDAEGTTNLSSTAADRLGNVGTGSVPVRLDKTAPTITATQSSAGWGEPTTVTFVCNDALSGIASCRADATSTDHVEVTGNGTVTGTAVDNAGNTKTLSVEVRNVDTTPPTLTGAPTTQPNTHGWYDGPVTIRWTAADPQSGIAGDPADTTISGEGADQTSTTTVANGAGLTTTATSAPPVSIDTTAPTTSVGGTSNDWVNGSVTLSLAASDNLAGVDFTSYSVDGGPVQRGTSLVLDTEGIHTIEYFSTDKAGNVEAATTTEVRIDKTLPTISHRFDPDGYRDGAWTNQDVTVTFLCADDGGSGVVECTDPVTKTAEGASQQVVGTVKDGAGNSATDTATVSIDKTDPVVKASVDREPNGAGWYDDDVTVSFTATDELSGIAEGPAPQVLREGPDQSASGTATDAAGNTAGASVSGINVDKTAPELVGEFDAGWHTGNVTVSWTCTDGLSGVATAPDDTVVTGEGENLSATATCTDRAGNTVSTTVTGIDIDRRAPHTTGSVRDPLASGWYGAPVEVTLTGEDTLSGVASTFYTIDGGEKRSYEGPFELDEEGTHSIAFWSVDRAGNVEDAGEPIELKIDTSAPVTTVTNPIVGNPDWWVTSGIPFSFDPQDGADRSGIAATYFTVDGTLYDYAAPVTIDLSTGVHPVTFWSVDRAGNVEEKQSFEVKVDTTPPTIAGEAFPKPNELGWNNTDVEVKFTCQDVGSGVQTGVAGCAGDTVLGNDGAGQRVRGDAVDVAGNKASTEVTGINIDKTKPTLVGVPSDANAVGWHKGDVTVRWVGDDALSGINAATQPADSTISGEGRDLTAGPKTIEDAAGNVSEPATVTGIKIDRTAPVIHGAPEAEANDAGWYNGEVVVDFTCVDPDLADGSAGSGVASCPTSKLIKGDGAGQHVTSDPATDVAGNRTPGKTVGGINIDGSAPSSTANNTCTAVNDWCKGDTADVVVTATDQTGLSGVKEIHYVVDGGEEKVVAGSSATVSVPLSGSGAGTVRYWAIDRAGNAETPNSVALKWDNIAPTVTHSLSPAPNANEWNNTDVTVTFAAKDDDKGSGVAGVTAPVKVTEETAGREITGTAWDKVGNVGTDKVTVRLDKTAPTITGAITNGTKGNNGWYVGPVTVTFTCDDALSGVATCPDPVVLTANGPNTATGTVTDAAGNTATTSVGGIRIDQEKPTLTAADINVQGGIYTLGSVPAATCTATDSFSGVESCTVVVVPTPSGVGTFTYTATATDKAGNTSTVDGSFRVVYKWGGFLQPINDTAHQVGASTSIFKAGSTVPVKFELRNSSGALVQAASAPSWPTPVKGSSMSVPVDESVYGLAADSGSDYRLDGKQYQYNWKTPSTGGSYYRIGVLLDDGQRYFVNIGLR